VCVTLHVAGHDELVKEWPLGKLITVVSGP
jgi:hypothetical protein